MARSNIGQDFRIRYSVSDPIPRFKCSIPMLQILKDWVMLFTAASVENCGEKMQFKLLDRCQTCCV